MARSKNNSEVFYFPGGKFELGETDLDCLKRESTEELGVCPNDSDIEFLAEFEDVAFGKPEGTKLNIRLYKVKLLPEARACSEIEEIKYFDSTIDSKNTDIIGKKIFSWLKERDYIN